jgi:transposase InsO family protein
MKDHKEEFCIEKMAKIFQVSRAGYYKFLQRRLSKRQKESNRLIKKIREIYRMGRETYGSPRIHKALKKEGEHCSRKRVAKLMKNEKIQPKMRKRWKTTTKRNPKAEPAANSLNQNFDVEGPNIAWV